MGDYLTKAGDLFYKLTDNLENKTFSENDNSENDKNSNIDTSYDLSTFEKLLEFVKKNKECSIIPDPVFDPSNEKKFNESEQTILHEILHTLKVPPKCGTNIDITDSFHVNG